MKRIFLIVAALMCGLSVQAVYYTSAPGSVNSGNSYTITAEEWGSGNTEVYLYKNGSFSAYSSGWSWTSTSYTSTDYGNQTINYQADSFLYDEWWNYYGSDSSYHSVTVSEPNTAPTISWYVAPEWVPVGQNYAVQARGYDQDGNLFGVSVWKNGQPYALNGGLNTYEKISDQNWLSESSPGQITFSAQAYDNSGAASEIIYFTVNIYVPNVAPTVAWQNYPPSSAYINQSFAVQAKANDGNGNLSYIQVWKNDQPFAINAASGSEAYSDNNVAVPTAPGPLTFKALAGDASGADSGFIYQTANIVNRAPTMTPTTITGATVTWDSTYQHYRMWAADANIPGSGTLTMQSTIQDADANLVNHTLRYRQVSVNPNTWYQLGSDSASGGSSTKQATLSTVETPGQWDFNAFGHDGLESHPGESKTVWVYGSTNGATFVSQAINSSVLPSSNPTISLNTGDSTATATILMLNSGNKLWQNPDAQFGTPHRLGAIGSTPTAWGADRRDMSTASIDPQSFPGTNDTATFTFTFNIPQAPGVYYFQWKMLEQGVTGDPFFEGATPSVTVTVVDTTPPTVPTFPTTVVTNLTHTGFTITWNASTDNSGVVAGYEITLSKAGAADQVYTVAGNVTNYTFTGLLEDTAYTVKVRAKDGKSPTPNWSAQANYSVTTDLNPAGDYDGDGMTNGYEKNNSLNPKSSTDALTDLDGDGLSNLAESNLGRSANSYDYGTSSAGNSIPAGWPNADANSSVAVGATSGQVSVDKSGALTYSVPIWTTPGSAGMQPQVSLNYSSQAGAGIAGFGWSLGGVSAITRGPKTKPIDGVNKGVTLTSDDQFYLDGQRLVLISGTHGQTGAEYRTEIDAITKVVVQATGGYGPTWFKAWTKAGLIIEFGNTNDSAFNSSDKPETLTWHVNRISDTKGSYMTFTYYEDTAVGVHRLERINYTGNGSVTPYASLRFEYGERPDWVKGYLAGAPVSSLFRLTKIKSYYGETVARTYTLGYSTRPHTSRSMLTTLVEEGSDGKSYPPLTFAYNDNQTGWIENNNLAPAHFLADNSNDGKPAGSGFVDLNGDGRTDFVARRDNSSGPVENYAQINTGSGWSDASGYLLPFRMAHTGQADDQGARFVDVNGDGLVDFLWSKQGSGGESHGAGARLNTGSGWETTDAPQWIPPAVIARDGYGARGGRFLDVNADGRADFVTYHGTQGYKLYVYLNTGSGWSLDAGFSSIATGDNNDISDYRGRFVDINGDGLVDIVAHFHGGGSTIRKKTWLNTGSGWVANTALELPQIIESSEQMASGAELADVNGDGLPDLVWYREYSAGNVARGVAINTGTQWMQSAELFAAYAPPHPLSRDGWYNAGSALIDLNADGIVDYAHSRQFSGGSEEKAVHYGTGRSWVDVSDDAKRLLPYLLLQGGISQVGADFVDLNGDGVTDVVWKRRHSNLSPFTSAQINQAKPTADRLKSVTNGFGVKVEIFYDSLLNPAVYTRAANNNDLSTTYPDAAERARIVNLAGPMQVVSRVRNENGAGGTHDIDYSYAKLRSHPTRGSLGFGWMKVHDLGTDIRTQTTFRQDYPLVGQPQEVKVTRVNDAGPLLSETITTWAVKTLNTSAAYPTRLPYASAVVEKTYDLENSNTLVLTTTTTTGEPDAYGNVGQYPQTINVSTSDGFTKSTTNQYLAADTTNWILGRLSESTVTSSAPGVTTKTRKSTFTYASGSGLLETETIEPDNATLACKVTTTYAYDPWGNKMSAATTAYNPGVNDANGDYTAGAETTRTTTTEYDARGRFPSLTKNALNHQETYTEYDEVLGVLKAMTGANGLPTSWLYDGFGRKVQETRADGTISYIRYKWAASGAPSGSLYLVETEATGSAPALAFYDKYARLIMGLGISGDGRIVYQSTGYDTLGRVASKSVPYYNENELTVHTTGTQYDILGRPKTVTTPDDENGTQTTTYGYSGFTVTVTDPKGRVSESTKNSQGWTLQNIRNKNAGSSAADYSMVSYTYDALGNLTGTTAAGETTSLVYDDRGRKTQMTDPNMGTWHYRYNGFGELIWQKDPKGQIVKMTYDSLGRMSTRVETEGTTTWTYDSSPRPGTTAWRGKLHKVETSPGGYVETHEYDPSGRPEKLTRTIDTVSYLFQTAYDTASRPIRTIYPQTGIGSEPISTRHVYNRFGYLKEMRAWLDTDTNPADGKLHGAVYWQADSYAVTGIIDGESYGNGLANDRVYSKATGRLQRATIDRGTVTAAPFFVQDLNYDYDAMGNVNRRNDVASGRDELFYTTNPGDGYDGLDRLMVHKIVSGATVTLDYNQKGNITNKSDVGAYSYGYTSAGRSNVLPHAVSAAGAKSYTYDAVGNMIDAKTGATVDRLHEWTSFNQLKKVTTGAISSEFSFGAAHERIKQVRKNGSTVTETTLYLGSLYEKVTTAATNLVEHKHYIMGPTGRIAVLTTSQLAGVTQANTTRYFHTDGLGSITVVSDEKGAVLKRYAYDAWGKQTATYTNTGSGITNQAPTTRGFTDHEMLADHGLIHMNGRVYDPVLGRFLSADPHIDDVDDPQAFNRYTYVSNNPLSYTDPTGYFKLKDAFKIVASLVIGYFTAGLAAPLFEGLKGIALLAAKGAAFGFGSSFSGSLLNGGSIGDAFKAGVIGAAQGALAGAVGGHFNGLSGSKLLIEGGRALAHGIVGGLASEAMGGEFRHGFYAGAAGSIGGSIAGALIGTGGEYWRIAARTVIAAVAGGTAAELGGGKFANGAFTAAFQHLVNHESSYLQDVGETFSGYALGFFEGFTGLSAGDGSMGSTVGDQGRSVGVGVGRAVQFLNLAKGAISLGRFLGARVGARAALSTADEAGTVVYRSVNAAGQVQYVGITNNLARRAARHLASKGIQVEKVLDGLSRTDARAVEQALIEIHGLAKNGGTLMNRINSIAATNPIYASAVQRGYDLLKTVGY